MSLGFASTYRLILVCLGALTAFGAVGARLVWLQALEADRYQEIVERARRQINIQAARRGDIRDANGNLLATSRSFIEVGVDPLAVRPQDRAKFPELARLLYVPLAEIEAASQPSPEGARQARWRKLTEGLDEDTYAKVVALNLRGVYGNRSYRRVYPKNGLAAHVVGFVNREDTPVAGVERHLDFYLRGQNGWVESERDGQRRELAQFRSREVEPTAGYDAVLSIDMVVQHIVEEELRKLVEKFNPAGASIIVTDPRDGFILALANYPSFDLNRFNEAPIENLRNIAVTDILEPGSTFKIVPAAGALNERLVSINSQFDCGADAIQIGSRSVRLPKDSHRQGVLSVSEIVAKSSNRGAAHLGVLLGPQRLYQYAHAFGFGELTGYPLDQEVRGILHPPSRWDGLTITRLPMGHAVSATPMQIHFAMATVANGGLLMKPQIVRRIVDSEGATVLSFEPRVRQRAVPEATAEIISRLLVKVVSPEGTARTASIPGFEVAGKTGTTQKIIDGRYSNQRHVGSFSGYFPASRPAVAITVVVDDAKTPGTAYGGTVAVPAFRSIAEQLIQYLAINPTEPTGAYAQAPSR
jgi:cell division protein FtsI (penicillin-binding protein 3)